MQVFLQILVNDKPLVVIVTVIVEDVEVAVIALDVNHHVLPQVFTLGDLTWLIVDELGIQMRADRRRTRLVQVVVVLESFLVRQLCVDLDTRGPCFHCT